MSLARQLALWALPALLVAAGLAQLGRWQLARAAEKEALLAGIEAARGAPLVDLGDLDPGADLRFRAVRVRGDFLADRQVLLDNQLRGGQPGVRAYVPLRLRGSDRLLLVDRGWLARPERSVPPAPVRLPGGDVELEGLLLAPPGAALALGAPEPPGWPLLVTRIDLPDLAHRLGAPLLDCVLEDRATPRAESIRAGMLPPERHRGYAVQWFGLSLTVILLYLVLAARAWRRQRSDR